MSLDAERWQRLSPLLDEALELPANAREAWLDALREREPDLVDELLQPLLVDRIHVGVDQ